MKNADILETLNKLHALILSMPLKEETEREAIELLNKAHEQAEFLVRVKIGWDMLGEQINKMKYNKLNDLE